MKKLLVACFACTASLFALTASAGTGEYWEITSKTEMPGMPFAMPSTTQKVCIGKGNEKQPRSSKDQDCQMSDVKISGNKTSWKMRCNSNGDTMTGEGEQTTNADSYEGVVHLVSSGKHAMNMTQHYSGKRVGGSCDTEELAKKVNKQIAQTCDTSGRSTPELINMGDSYLGKGAMCANKRDEACSAIRRDAGSDVDAYTALVEHDKQVAGTGAVNVAKACGVNMAAATKSVCKMLNGKNYSKLSPYCPAEAKAYKEAQRKAQASRDYTGRDYTADDQGSGDSGSSKSSSNPADAAIEGAKKLKGLFGF